MSVSVSTQELRALYRKTEHAGDLFPIFERTRSFEPWIVILALIPALYVFQSAALSESDAEWVLRSRDLLHADTLDGVIGPGGVDSDSQLRFQPPMATWLTAALWKILPEFGGYEGMFLSWIGTALLILLSYQLTKTLLGGRIAFWAALLASGQGLILWQAQTVLPVSLAILTALGAVAFLQDHLFRERGAVTWQILGGGVCLGLCLLLGGPIVVLPLVIQCLMVIAEIRAEQGKKVSIVSPAKRMLSLALMWTICLIASGWWPVLMASAYGQEFWISWWRGIDDESPPHSILNHVFQFLKVTGPMLGLAVYGAVKLHKQAVRERDRAARQLVLWLVGGTATAIASAWVLGTESLLPMAAVALISLVLVICSAITFDCISRGHLRVVFAVLLVIAPLLAVILFDLLTGAAVSQDVRQTRGLALLCLLTLVALRVVRQRTRLGGPQLLPGACLLLIVVINYRIGLAAPLDVNTFTRSTPTLETEEISQLHKVFQRFPSDIKCVEIISPRNRTARFRLELAIAFPEAKISLAENWSQVHAKLGESGNREITAVIEWGVALSRFRPPLTESWKHRYLGQPERIGGTDQIRLSVLFPLEN
jgi:hypothetical protein